MGLFRRKIKCEKCDKRFASGEQLEKHRVEHAYEMDVDKLKSLVSEAKIWAANWSNPRAVIYLNESKVSSFYRQYISEIVKLDFSNERSHELEGGLQAFVASLRGKFGWKGTIGAGIEILPPLMAILLEYHVGKIDRLTNHTAGEINNDAWFTHVGSCYITPHSKEVIAETNPTLASNLQQLLQRKRLEEQERLSIKEERANTIVAVWKKDDHYLASIADTEWIDPSNYASYSYSPSNIGIFGRFQAAN